MGVRGVVGYCVRACFRQENEEAKNKLRTQSAHQWWIRIFLVIATKKKDYHWRIFLFSFFFEERKRKKIQKQKKPSARGSRTIQSYIYITHSYSQVLSFVWGCISPRTFFRLKALKKVSVEPWHPSRPPKQ